MNTSQDDGGPAFPQGNPEMVIAGQSVKETQGMSLRDWFAKEGARIHAEGLLALGHQPSSHWEEICREGIAFADAMLAARKEKS